ncbi:VPS4-like protein [Mya arenaria]|uniref:VPS4-like protein n=1 Tax=Mya arenaria TaxID=6604 RepID=A0ABY7ERK0_MYAAR|nr:VPS4-like protein [Mya arenaria]
MIKFYCPTHGDLGCGDCVVLDHRSCKVDYIAEVAKDFVIGNEFRELEPTIKRKDDILSGCIRNVEEFLDEVENQSKDEIARLRKFRAEINNYLDRREKELLDNLQKVKTEDENVLTDLKTDYEAKKSGLEALRTELSSAHVSVNQRYVAARKAQKELHDIKDEIEKKAGLMIARKLRFTKDSNTERLLGSSMGMGTLDVVGEFRKEKFEMPEHRVEWTDTAAGRDVTCFYVNAWDLLGKYSGDPEEKLRALFSAAQSREPAIIFLDDIEVIGSDSENDRNRRACNEMLIGFSQLQNNVFVVGLTHAPWAINLALLKRFSKRLYMPLPDTDARTDILCAQLRYMDHTLTEEHLRSLSSRCAGFSGSDLVVLVRDVAMKPVRRLQAATHFKRANISYIVYIDVN